jgi:hypothetical protein
MQDVMCKVYSISLLNLESSTNGDTWVACAIGGVQPGMPSTAQFHRPIYRNAQAAQTLRHRHLKPRSPKFGEDSTHETTL